MKILNPWLISWLRIGLSDSNTHIALENHSYSSEIWPICDFDRWAFQKYVISIFEGPYWNTYWWRHRHESYVFCWFLKSLTQEVYILSIWSVFCNEHEVKSAIRKINDFIGKIRNSGGFLKTKMVVGINFEFRVHLRVYDCNSIGTLQNRFLKFFDIFLISF